MKSITSEAFDCLLYCELKGCENVTAAIREEMNRESPDFIDIVHRVHVMRNNDVQCLRFLLSCIWDGLTPSQAVLRGNEHMIRCVEELCYVASVNNLEYDTYSSFMRKIQNSVIEWSRCGIHENAECLQGHLRRADGDARNIPGSVHRLLFDKELYSYLSQSIWDGIPCCEIVSRAPERYNIGTLSKLKCVCKRYQLKLKLSRLMRAVRQNLGMDGCTHELGHALLEEIKLARKTPNMINVKRLKSILQQIYKVRHRSNIVKH